MQTEASPKISAMSDDAMVARRRFQIHLSTAIVLMIVAGLLIFANVADSRFELMHGKAFLLSSVGRSMPPHFGWTEMDCSFEKFQNSTEFKEWTGDSELYFGWPFDAK